MGLRKKQKKKFGADGEIYMADVKHPQERDQREIEISLTFAPIARARNYSLPTILHMEGGMRNKKKRRGRRRRMLPRKKLMRRGLCVLLLACINDPEGQKLVYIGRLIEFSVSRHSDVIRLERDTQGSGRDWKQPRTKRQRGGRKRESQAKSIADLSA